MCSVSRIGLVGWPSGGIDNKSSDDDDMMLVLLAFIILVTAILVRNCGMSFGC